MSRTQVGKIPSLKALQAFEAAGRLGSFTKAADELFVTPGAISRHISGLERSLGVPLFERAGRSLSLTPGGRQYLTVLTDSFDRIKWGTESIRAHRISDAFTVSMLPSFAARWLAPRLAEFVAAHPQISLRISASRALTRFDQEDVDAAIRYGPGGWPDVDAELLMEEEVFPVCSPSYAKGPPALTLANLGTRTLLHGDIRDDWRAWLKFAGVTHIDARYGPRFNEDITLLQAAVLGTGIALGRSVLVESDLQAKILVAPFRPRLKAAWSYWFVTPRGRQPHRHSGAFRDWIRSQIRQRRPSQIRNS